MDNDTPAQSIQKAEAMQGKGIESYEDSHFNPRKNEKAISLIQQADGNWKAWMQKSGKIIEVRAGKPEDAVVELLTHS